MDDKVSSVNSPFSCFNRLKSTDQLVKSPFSSQWNQVNSKKNIPKISGESEKSIEIPAKNSPKIRPGTIPAAPCRWVPDLPRRSPRSRWGRVGSPGKTMGKMVLLWENLWENGGFIGIYSIIFSNLWWTIGIWWPICSMVLVYLPTKLGVF